MREWAKGLYLAIKLCPEIWNIDSDEGYDATSIDFSELNDIEKHDSEFDTMLANYYEEEIKILHSYAVIKGVAYPERIPEIFHKPANSPNALDWRDPNLEAKLFEMLEDAVETLREYAELYQDDSDEDFEA